MLLSVTAEGLEQAVPIQNEMRKGLFHFALKLYRKTLRASGKIFTESEIRKKVATH